MYKHLIGKLLTAGLLVCNAVPAASADTAPDLHQWSAEERFHLQRLWIEGLDSQPDRSNRVVEDPAAIGLGHRLFFDRRLSADGSIACASCHKPESYFTDGLDVAEGLSQTDRNTPTVVGASHSLWFFHDGRSDSLWSQALGPLENEREHGGNRARCAHLVFEDPKLRAGYEAAFGPMPDITDRKRFPPSAGPVADKSAAKAWQAMAKADRELITAIFVNIGKALAAYQTRLQPAPSRFDNYVASLSKGDQVSAGEQLSEEELKGLRIFLNKGNCILCHSGPLFTDKGFHNISVPAREGKAYDWGRYTGGQQVVKSPFNCRGEFNDAENKACQELEYIVLEKNETLGSMKTPSLRNVAKTAPYMHAGQYKTLREVIEHYNDPPPLKYRISDLFLDVDLNEQEMIQLEAFLKSLNSDIAADPAYLGPPS